MQHFLSAAAAFLSLAISLLATATSHGKDKPPAWAAPPLDRAVSVRDGRTGDEVSIDAFLNVLAEAEAVFLGETHNDETTHRVELAIYEGLLARKENKVVLAMEMFERDVQKQLDQYLAGEIDEPTFLADVRPWGNYLEAYRALIERAKAAGRPVVASNFPMPLRRKLAIEGRKALSSLEGDAARQVPAQFLPNTDAYWQRVDNAVRGHRGMVLRNNDDPQRLYLTQSLWDNAMGEACAVALDKHPGHLVLHVNGGFHSAYWDGTVHQFRLRKPDVGVKTVSIVPVANPTVEKIEGIPIADFVVLVEARATNLNEGQRSVVVERELKYRFHLPKNAAKGEPVPLFIWLSDDGFTAADGLALWKDRLGDRAAIVSIEAPYRAVGEDLSFGGRWFWSDTFSSDVGTLVTGTERIWAYLLRHFPIDPGRVCVAGEGTGATVAVAVAPFTTRIDVAVVALGPRAYTKIKDIPLPLPKYWGDEPVPTRSLRIVGREDDRNWWSEELKEYAGIDVDSQFILANDDPWKKVRQTENLIGAALGLDERPTPSSQERRFILVENDSPRFRYWARLHALWAAAKDGVRIAVTTTQPSVADAVRLSTEVEPESFATAGALPPCPGPFGGTTVLVLPDDASPRTIIRWLALAEDDPLAAESRFHRVRIATDGGEQDLVGVLKRLRAEGRKNILLVPAVFCADSTWMRAIRQSVRDLENQMTFHWLPGLGGRKAAIGRASRGPQGPQRPQALAPSPARRTSDCPTSDSEVPSLRARNIRVAMRRDERSAGAAVRGQHQASAQPSQEAPVLHKMSVVLEPKTHKISVRDSITLPPSLARAGAEFTMSSALSVGESDPPVEEIASDGQEIGAKSIVRYRLTAEPKEGVLEISYDGVFNFGLSDQKEEYTRGFRETDGMIGPEGVYLDGGSVWTPQFGDRLVRFSMTVQMPDDWHIISQGKGTSRDGQGRARWDSEGAMEQVYVVGGPLHVERDAAGAVEALVYLRNPDDALARKYLDATARYIEMYRQLIGPYPYAKFALVENFWETGYGMPSFTLLGPQVIRFPFIINSSYPHEILHNWWGNAVFVDYENGNWCEGLTAYMADHLLQEQRGKGTEYRRSSLQKYRDYVKAGRDFPLTEFRDRHSAATEAVGYGKALMMFHMLRRHVGDDAFRAALAGFYRKNRGHRASFDDLRKSFESVTGEDLQPFFTQWVKRSGAPALLLNDVTVERSADRYQVTGSIEQTQRGELYALDVPVTIETADGPSTTMVTSQQRSTSFEIKTTSKPVLLAVDPMFDLFRHLDPRETPPSIGQLFGEPRIVAILPTNAEPAVRARYQQLAEAWQSESHAIEIVNDNEVESLPVDRAVWVLGRRNRFKTMLIGASDDAERNDPTSVYLGFKEVRLDGHSVVVIRRHPTNVEKAIGWISVDPAAAFPGIIRKLPHYGKYSYLAFEGHEPANIVKGQWPVTRSPLLIDLRTDRSGLKPTITAKKRDPLAVLPPIFSRKALVGHVAWLAAPERNGRGLGTTELKASADYIARKMADVGLVPGGDDGTWFQHFTVAKGPDRMPVKTKNVVGLLPGSRTDWADQSIVVGAHYDHLGRGWPDVRSGNEGKIHPGADDNASGIAVLLELARNLVDQGGGSRNLVFVAFSAEECGRHGSQFYAQKSRFPGSEIRAMINLDSVGRLGGRTLAIHGTGTADEWQHIFHGCGFVTGIASRNVPDFADGSDQMSFIAKGIPAVQIFTGIHEDYHRPTDTLDKIDGTGLVKVATFVKEAIVYLLEREERLTVRIDIAESKESERGTRESAGRKVLFGTVPTYGFQGDGVRIESLVANSPAANAGLEPGDVIVRIDDEPIADLRAFSKFLKTLEPGQRVIAVVVRDGKKVTAQVTVATR